MYGNDAVVMERLYWATSQLITTFTTYNFNISFVPSCFILSTLSKIFQTSLFNFLLVKLGFELSVVLLLVGLLD